MYSISRPFSESLGTRTHRVLGWLAACVLLAGGAASQGGRGADETGLKVKAEGQGNSLTVKSEGNAVIVDLSSRSGIGSAKVEQASGPAPEKIVVRLRLKGLEDFRFSQGTVEITARVSSGDGRVTQSVRSRDGAEQPITSTSPRWLNVRIVSDQSTPRIPLEQGHFEITLPRDVFGKGRRSFSIRWIDFYRN